MNNTLGYMAQPLRVLRTSPTNCTNWRPSIPVMDCNAADLHDDPHVWDFGTGDHFVCFGTAGQ